MCKKSLRVQKKILGEMHPNVATVYRNLACLYERQERHECAMAYAAKAYRIYRSCLGVGHPYTQSDYDFMKKTYAEWKPDGNFDKWLEAQMREK